MRPACVDLLEPRGFAQKRRKDLAPGRVGHANLPGGELAPVTQPLGSQVLLSSKKRVRHFATVPASPADEPQRCLLCKAEPRCERPARALTRQRAPGDQDLR